MELYLLEKKTRFFKRKQCLNLEWIVENDEKALLSEMQYIQIVDVATHDESEKNNRHRMNRTCRACKKRQVKLAKV